jgi:FKBP-type peptidyl-prolyl cis-trans isomerase 2
LEGAEAAGVGAATVAEEVQHGGAGVDGEGVEVGLLGEEAGQEAAVAVAEDEGSVAWGKLREEVVPGAGEERAEGEVLGPAVEVGDAVEVRLRDWGHWGDVIVRTAGGEAG